MLQILRAPIAAELIVEQICLASDSVAQVDCGVVARGQIVLEQFLGQLPLGRHELGHVDFVNFLAEVYKEC